MSTLRPAASALSRLAAALAVASLGACAGHPAPRAGMPPPLPTVERGDASWYGPGFHGRRTASGERYDMHAMTAAHRTLPFGTLLEVRNLDNGEITRVRVNDRGPFKRNRILDLSYAAAKQIEMIGPGTAHIELRVLGAETPLRRFNGLERYTVQVGAFSDPERAAALCSELRMMHPEAEVRSDGIWHRVQLGVFDRRALAEDLRETLRDRGYGAIVVVAPPAS